MIQHILATLRSGMRSHSFRGVCALALFLIALAYLSSNFSGRHPQTIALDVGISGIRIISCLLVLFWLQELLAKEVDRRSVYVALSHPVPRWQYLLGRYLGVVIMLALAIFFLSAVLYALVAASGDGYKQAFAVQFGTAYLINMLLIILDGAILAAFTTLISSFATSPLLTFSLGACFALIARSYGSMTAFLQDKNGEGADISHIYLPIMQTISYLFPDLGGLDTREMLLYQTALPSTLPLTVLSCLFYAGFCLWLACRIFDRREFN